AGEEEPPRLGVEPVQGDVLGDPGANEDEKDEPRDVGDPRRRDAERKEEQRPGKPQLPPREEQVGGGEGGDHPDAFKPRAGWRHDHREALRAHERLGRVDYRLAEDDSQDERRGAERHRPERPPQDRARETGHPCADSHRRPQRERDPMRLRKRCERPPRDGCDEGGKHEREGRESPEEEPEGRNARRRSGRSEDPRAQPPEPTDRPCAATMSCAEASRGRYATRRFRAEARLRALLSLRITRAAPTTPDTARTASQPSWLPSTQPSGRDPSGAASNAALNDRYS